MSATAAAAAYPALAAALGDDDVDALSQATDEAKVERQRLFDEARQAAKNSILDTLGVILAASGMEPAVRGVVDIVKESGGAPQCTVL